MRGNILFDILYTERWMNMKKRLFIISFSLLLIFTGCSTNIQGEDLMKGIKAQEIKCKDEVEAENTDITDFALRLYKANEENEKNTLISPISVIYALSMTANGAKEETRNQMENVLGLPIEELNNYLYSYMKLLPQGENYKFNLANSIWFTDDERFTVNQDFLQLNADYYGADIYRTPFDNSTVKDINNWVKNNTNDMIPKVLGEIPSNAIMYLVNALAFEAEWADIYEENQVRDGEFKLEDGTVQTVEFMRGEEHNYIEDENATGFLKYYKDCKYAFVALLPDESLSISDYISTLDGRHLTSLIENKTNTTVYTTIPKFETEYSLEMSKVLQKMGMVDAFDRDTANFTGLGTSTDGNIYIDFVLHKTYISVAEKGTKAGAVTVVATKDAAGFVEEPKEVYLNRPFIYMLIDCETNIPFFIGTMMNVNG